MDSISDFFKKLCISAKEKEVDKILAQIPDQETKESYFYNWFIEEWKLLGGMKEKQILFNFDDSKNLKVNVQESKLLETELKTELWKLVDGRSGSGYYYEKEIAFLARSISFQFQYIDMYSDITIYEKISPYCEWQEVKKFENIYTKTLHVNLSGVKNIRIKMDTQPVGGIIGYFKISNFFFLTKYTDSEAINAMGVKANDNPLHHDRTTPYTHPNNSSGHHDSHNDSRFLKLVGGILTGTLNCRHIIPTLMGEYDLGSYSYPFNDVHCYDIVDYSKFPKKLVLSDIMKIKSIKDKNDLNHSTLPIELQRENNGRSVGYNVSFNTKGIQELYNIILELKQEIEVLKIKG